VQGYHGAVLGLTQDTAVRKNISRRIIHKDLDEIFPATAAYFLSCAASMYMRRLQNLFTTGENLLFAIVR
jgi:hypothetical protein